MSIVYLKYIFHKHLLDLLEAQAHFGGQTLYGRPGAVTVLGGRILAETQDVHYCLPAGLKVLSSHLNWDP